MTTTADNLRSEAAALRQEAADSFDRCDTDGFLSQWAAGITAQHKDAEARLIDEGGVSRFITLFDLDGNWVPSRIVDGKWGTSWMILDADGNRTGEYVPFMPKRRDTLAKRGYVEGYGMFPAKIAYTEGRGGVASVRVARLRNCPDHQPPTTIISVDRWAEDPTR